MSFFQNKRKHHRIRKNRSKKKSNREGFVISYIFKFSGIIILLFGVYYSLNSMNFFFAIQEFIINLFKQNADLPLLTINKGRTNTIAFYFTPGLIIVFLSSFFTKRFTLIPYWLSILSIIYFLIFQIKIVSYDVYHGGAVYPAFYVAELVLILTTIGPYINSVILKKPLILLLTSIYFYLSLVLVMTRLNLNNLLLISLVFSINIAWSSGKIKDQSINFINYLFSIGYFGLFWLRKLMVNTQPEYLLPFFVYGALFYILFYGIIFYTSLKNEKVMPKWMQMVIGVTNLIFYFGTTALVIDKYFSFNNLWAFSLVLLLFNVLGLYLSSKRFLYVWKLPLHIITILLASLVLPLLLNQNTLLLFTAAISVILLLYSKYSKNQSVIIISIVAMGIMSFDFFFHWIFKYLPVLLFTNSVPSTSIIVHGIVSGTTMVVALTLNSIFLKNMEISFPKTFFSRLRYIRLINGLTLFSLFLTSGWIISAILSVFYRSMHLTSPGWFISGSLFFILMILIKPQRFSSFTKPLLFLSLGYTIFYPLLVHLTFLGDLYELILSGIISGKAVFLHYLALFLLILLARISLVRIQKRYATNKTINRGMQLSGLIILLFILCTEYDNLSILLRIDLFQINPSIGWGQGILEFNHRLPYSIILILSSIGILIWALFKHHLFLRTFSILLFSFSILKIFLYDFPLLGESTRTILFFMVGSLLLGFSMFYPRLKKIVSETKKSHHHKHYKQVEKEKNDLRQ